MPPRIAFHGAAGRETDMAENAPARAAIFFEQSITWLYTQDLDRLAGFYGEVLGLPFVMDQEVAGGRTRIYRASPTHFIGLCDIPGRPLGTKGMIFTFLVPDLEQAHAALAARGVPFESAPDMTPGKLIHSCFFHDPEGYKLELQEFGDPRWPFPDGRGPRRR
jgi:catechol 2,3-dioxygenase-like lactoylglutathione lyase family enzyme